MAAFPRTISRTVTNAFPAWRTAMTVTDRLYYATAQPPGYAPALTLPTRFGRSGALPLDGFGAAWDIISGYSSGQLLDDVGGPFGTMVYGTGGHAIIANQILALGLSADSPGWSWWHQPNYQTADVNGANLYYSPAEEAALVAGPRGTAARIRVGQEPTDAPLWDRQFPVAYAGWIFPRKLTTGQMGNNVPHGFRYSATQYIPASMTGTDPMFFTITGAQGPFDQAANPATVSMVEWFDSSVLIESNTKRRMPYYFRNCQSGDWTMHLYQPDGVQIGGYSSPAIGVFRDIKRIYVVGGWAGSNGYYYIDMANGFASHTVQGPFQGHANIHGFSSGAFSEGDPLGRHFMVTLSNESFHNTKLVVYNFDLNTSFRIDLAAAGLIYDAADERVGISWDPINRRVLLVMFDGTIGELYYWSITVPDDLTNAAGWVASKRVVTLDDAAMATTVLATGQSNQNALCGFYGKTRLHPMLGAILIPSADYRNLAFVPSV